MNGIKYYTITVESMHEKGKQNKGKNQGTFSVSITDFGRKGLYKITKRNQKVRKMLEGLIEQLKNTPTMGKVLTANLNGMRSLRSNDQKFRIVYKLDEPANHVMIHAIDRRKNVYTELDRWQNTEDSGKYLCASS